MDRFEKKSVITPLGAASEQAGFKHLQRPQFDSMVLT